MKSRRPVLVAAVAEDVRLSAAGFFQRVGQDRQALECAIAVDALGKPSNRTIGAARGGRRPATRP